MRPRSTDVIVVGAGPAGLAAAVQLVRQGIDTIVLEKHRPGGQVATANLVENYLGLYRLPGGDIARLFVRHAIRAGVRIVRAEVLKIARRGHFVLQTSKGEWGARAVVVATGAVPRVLEGAGGAVDYDTNDLPDFRGKRVAVLGSGDAAFDRALRIVGVAASVRILCRGAPSALPLLVERCRRAGVSVVVGAGEPGISIRGRAVHVRTLKGDFRADRLVASIGKKPAAPILPWPLGRLKPAFPDGRTTMAGLYVIGDLASGRDRYLSVATGMGVASAMHIGRYLRMEKKPPGEAREWS